MFKLLQDALIKQPIDEDLILKNQGIYKHFNYHSDISALKKTDLLAKISHSNNSCRNWLIKSHWIIITFGTAIAYRHKKLNTIVSNCHKIPAHEFDKKMLHPDDILKAFQVLYDTLKAEKSNFFIILTVSPVRHIKESLETNNVSKSILRYTCETLRSTYPEVQYFPSYEMMMDDLRDYRFYERDMLHPNASAIEYIWEAFQKSYFDVKTIQFVKEWGSIRNALQHRPFFPDSDEHQQFIRNTIQKLHTFSHITDITNELKILEKQLI
jgi:hypothetical protein